MKKTMTTTASGTSQPQQRRPRTYTPTAEQQDTLAEVTKALENIGQLPATNNSIAFPSTKSQNEKYFKRCTAMGRIDWPQTTEDQASIAEQAYEKKLKDDERKEQQQSSAQLAPPTLESTRDALDLRGRYFARHLQYICLYFRLREREEEMYGTISNVDVYFVQPSDEESADTATSEVVDSTSSSTESRQETSAQSTVDTTDEGSACASTSNSATAGTPNNTATVKYRAQIQLQYFTAKQIKLTPNAIYVLEHPTDETFNARDDEKEIRVTVCGAIPTAEDEYVSFFVFNGPTQMPTNNSGYTFKSATHSYTDDILKALHQFCMYKMDAERTNDDYARSKALAPIRYLLYGPLDFSKKNDWQRVDRFGWNSHNIQLTKPLPPSFKDAWNSAQWREMTPENQRRLNLPKTLNESQINVINWTMQHNCSVIRGPPGCGKTLMITMLCMVLKNEFNKDYAIRGVQSWKGKLAKPKALMLITAPSNQACEVLTKMLNETGIDTPFLTSLARQKLRTNSNYLHMRVYKRLSDADKAIFDDEAAGIFLEDPQEQKKYRERVRVHTAAVFEDADAVICTIPIIPKLRTAFNHLVFTAVIVDEASQCTETELLLPLTQSAQKVILVGDEKQLGPTITCQTPQADLTPETLDVMDALDNSGFYSIVERFGDKNFIQDLNVQYRMMPSIFELVALRIYEGIDANTYFQPDCPKNYLRIGTTQLNHRFGDDPAGRYITFHDTFPSNAKEYSPETTHSIANAVEATQLIDFYDKNKDLYKEKKWSVGIIAPYLDQVHLLQQSFSRKFGTDYLAENSITIGSVDGYQGSECDVIFISTTRANHTGNIGFLADKARLNVMLTRAKHRMHIFGCSKTLRQSKSKLLLEYYNYGSAATIDVYDSATRRIQQSRIELIP